MKIQILDTKYWISNKILVQAYIVTKTNKKIHLKTSPNYVTKQKIITSSPLQTNEFVTLPMLTGCQLCDSCSNTIIEQI